MTLGKLGNKHECRVCGKKFYDLGKPKAICPQCGTEQKEMPSERRSASSRRRRTSPALKERILVPNGIEDDGGDDFADDKAEIDIDLDGLEGEDDEEEE